MIALAIRVDLDSPELAASLTPMQQRKLAAGIVCTRGCDGVTIAWGLQSSRPERASTFTGVDAAIAWLLERAEGLRLTASLCPGTATAVYSSDRAAFLNSCATTLRSYADRLWTP